MFSEQSINPIFNQSNSLIPDTNLSFGQSSDALGLEPSFQGRSASMLSSSAALVATPNTLGSANNLGSFAETSDIKISGAVDSDDRTDYHRFTLMNFGSVRLDLQGLQANADLRVIRDVNSNGRIDAGDELIKSQSVGTNKDSITLDGLGVGTYFAEVKSVDGASTTYDLLLDYKKGLRDFESEPNNSIAAPDFVGGNLNTTRLFRGEVSRFDQSDVYKFHVDTPSSFFATLRPDSANANLELIRDSNRNGVVDAGEVIDSSFKLSTVADTVSTERLEVGDYFLRVTNSGVGSTTYNLDLTATPLTRANFGITITNVKAIDDMDFSYGMADFITKTRIDGVEKEMSLGSDWGNGVEANATHSRAVDIGDRYIPFSIQLWDRDSFSGAEQADINPLAGQRDLTLTYDTLTGRVLGNELNANIVYEEGERITIQGAGDNDRARITFKVDYSALI